MRRAIDERNAQAATAETVASISQRWPEIREVLSEEERRELGQALVSDVTITALNQVTVTGTLPADWCSKTVEIGSA